MRQINLLPKIEQKSLMISFFSEQLNTFWIFVVVSLLLVTTLTYVAKFYLAGELSDIDGQIAAQRQILKTSDNELLKRQVETLNSQVGSLQSLRTQHYYWSSALVELSKLFASDITLNSVQMDRSTGRVSIAGIASTRESVLKFWSDIHKSEFFTDINFPLANLNSATADPFSFSFFINKDRLLKP